MGGAVSARVPINLLSMWLGARGRLPAGEAERGATRPVSGAAGGTEKAEAMSRLLLVVLLLVVSARDPWEPFDRGKKPHPVVPEAEMYGLALVAVGGGLAWRARRRGLTGKGKGPRGKAL